MIGKMIRLERILNRETGRTVIVPMDHGVTVGPIDGLIDMKTTVDSVAMGGANAIVIHKGLVGTGHRRRGRDVGSDRASVRLHQSFSLPQCQDPGVHRGRGHQVGG